MNASDRNREDNRTNEPELKASAMAARATVEPELYVGFANWLDRDLARLEALYKDWATAGYGQWRRSIEVRR